MWNNTFLEFKRRIEVGILWNQIPGLNVKRNFGWSGWIRWCQISRFVSHTCIDYSWDWIEILVSCALTNHFEESHEIVLVSVVSRSVSFIGFRGVFFYIYIFLFLHSLNFMTLAALWYPLLDPLIRSPIDFIMQFVREKTIGFWTSSDDHVTRASEDWRVYMKVCWLPQKDPYQSLLADLTP